MKWLILLLGAILVSYPVTARRTKANRIIAGRVADIEEFPYQVAILLFSKPICGGSIINEYIILTAAHCAPHLAKHPEMAQVRVGSSLAQSGGSLHEIEKMAPHAKYDDGEIDHHDIALVLLKTPITFSNSAKPVKLTKTTPKPGEKAYVTGFGKTNDEHSSVDLMAVELPIVGLKKCKSILKAEGGTVTDDMICAGFTKGHKDACTGDSGGPLAINGVQVGVVAWGIECGKEGLPGVYTNVAIYRNWISRGIKTLMKNRKKKSG